MPRISVLIPAHNCAPFVESAVRSILDQSYRDIEVLIADDGSTDGTWRILERLARDDERIHLYRNERNIGLARTLNLLVNAARGEYVARLDADDVSLPQRLERQLRFMEIHELSFTGTWARTFGLRRDYVLSFPVTDAEIRAHLLFQSAFGHYTVMARRELFLRHPYRPEAGRAEDYDLWVRISADARMGNLPEPLVLYRQHASQVSVEHARSQWEDARHVRRLALQLLGPPASEDDKRIHERIRYPVPISSREELLAMERWLLTLTDHFRSEPTAMRVVARQWIHVCLRAGALGPWAARTFLCSRLRRLGASTTEAAMVASLCLFRVRYRSPLYERLLGTILSLGLTRTHKTS